ncbi:MAG: M48 family metallopeptidase [Enterobacterales bacterium]|nr:M48 family metallopeptidase [Enterobacterales bacterium]
MQIEVIKSRRKTMALQLRNAQHLVVRVPLRASKWQVNRFVDSHARWITKQQQRLQQNPGLPENQYENGGFLWLLGERYAINVVIGKRNIIRRDSNDAGTINENENDNDKTLDVYHPTGESMSVERQIKQWQRDFAYTTFEALIAKQYNEFPIQLPAFSMTVRQMRRQWGNCSRDGRIKLSINLIRYPEVSIKHVIYHELCHLIHFNHSRDFYALLEKVEPDWQANKQLLGAYSG